MSEANLNEWRPYLTVRITVAAIIGAIALAFIVAFLSAPGFQEEIRFTANVVSWAGGIYGVYHTAISLRLNLYRDRQKRAYEILDSLNKVDSAALRSMIDAVLAAAPERSLAFRKMKDDPNQEGAVRYVLGILEDMAIAIRTGYADENVLFASIRGVAIRYHTAFLTYIEELRTERRDPKIYIELERLTNAWRNNKSMNGGEMKVT